MKQIMQYAAQAVVYAGFAYFLAAFASGPDYSRIPEDQALIKLSFAHSAKAKGGCRKRTQEELMELAPNMRKPEICPRRRLPVTMQLKLDNTIIYQEKLEPTGLHSDGPSITYQRILIPAGRHEFIASLTDTTREEGFDYVSRQTVDIVPGQSLAIDFMGTGVGFLFE